MKAPNLAVGFAAGSQITVAAPNGGAARDIMNYGLNLCDKGALEIQLPQYWLRARCVQRNGLERVSLLSLNDCLGVTGAGTLFSPGSGMIDGGCRNCSTQSVVSESGAVMLNCSCPDKAGGQAVAATIDMNAITTNIDGTLCCDAGPCGKPDLPLPRLPPQGEK